MAFLKRRFSSTMHVRLEPLTIGERAKEVVNIFNVLVTILYSMQNILLKNHIKGVSDIHSY